MVASERPRIGSLPPGGVSRPDPLAAFLRFVMPDLAWMRDAACRTTPYTAEELEAVFFPARGYSLEPARSICRDCGVRGPCLEFALLTDAQGVWGGTSARERRILRRNRVTGGAPVPAIVLTLLGDDDPPPWPELTPETLVYLPDSTWDVAVIDHGMSSGNASVALRLELPDGRVLIAETSLAAWSSVTIAGRARNPEQFADGPLAER